MIVGVNEACYSDNIFVIAPPMIAKYYRETGERAIVESEDEMDDPSYIDYPVPDKYAVPIEYRNKR